MNIYIYVYQFKDIQPPMLNVFDAKQGERYNASLAVLITLHRFTPDPSEWLKKVGCVRNNTLSGHHRGGV